MSRTRIIGGKLTEIIGGDYNIHSASSIIYNSAKNISFTGNDGVTFGKPAKLPKNEIEESQFKLESTYIHDHIKSVASEMVSKFDTDNTGIVYKIYKDISEGKIINLPIVVTKSLHSGNAFYDEESKKIIIWETNLLNIEKDNDRKIKLIASLTEAYGKYVNSVLKESLQLNNTLETYDYDLFKFDILTDEVVTIAKLESPNFTGNLDISFPKEENEKPQSTHYRQKKQTRGGPNPGDIENYEEFNSDSGPGDDPPFNVGLKFSYSLGGGFTASLYAGISRETAKAKDMHLMLGLNAALTYHGNGAPGTSSLSPNLINATLTPSATLGYKTGNSLNMNLFNNFTGSGVNNPYEYAFTLGSTAVLSSGRVSQEFKDGILTKNKFNSQDNRNRNQIVGGAAIKVGNFMISSYNDIFKLPLFLGMGSDQYWSAGVNVQAKITDLIKMAYAFDLYYGKSNNKAPFNADIYLDKQNYDHQQLFDILLNRGQETFNYTDANGFDHQSTKFGYGTFWPSNKMHDTIVYPTKPVEPKKPNENDYKSKEEIDKAKKQYNKELLKYKEAKINFKLSTELLENSPTEHRHAVKIKGNDKKNPQYYSARTFHHLFVVYNEYNQIEFPRLQKYFDAEIPQKEVQEFIIKMNEQKNDK